MSLEKKLQEHREAFKQQQLEQREALPEVREQGKKIEWAVRRGFGLIVFLWGVYEFFDNLLKWNANGGSIFETQYFFYDKFYLGPDYPENVVPAGWSWALLMCGFGLIMMFFRFSNIKAFGGSIYDDDKYKIKDEEVQSHIEELQAGQVCEVFKGICEHCDGHISYPPSMERQKADCPSCGQSTILVDASDFI